MTRPPTSSFRRWWLWLTAAVVGVVGLLAGGVALDRYLARKAWADACAEADRLDPGWRWDDLMAARPYPPDDRNAAVRLRDVGRAMPQKWPDWTAAVRPEDIPPLPDDGLPPGGPPDERREEYARGLEDGIAALTPAQQLRPDQAAALVAVVSAAANALPLTVGLEDLSPGRLPHDRVRPLLNDLFPPRVQQAREVAQLLRLHATLLAQDGRLDDALADCRRMLVAGRTAAAEPMFITELVEMAVRATAVGRVERVLAQGEPGPVALDQSRQAFAAALAAPVLLDALRGERAFTEDLVTSADEGLVDPEKAFEYDVPSVTGYARIDRWLHRLRGGAWTKRQSAAVLRFETLLVEMAKQSPDAPRARAAEIAAYRAALSPQLQKAIQSYDALLQAERRSRALVASTMVALAAERFRRDRGRWPDSVAELVGMNLLAAVPTDPFDGQPLRLKRLADGLVVYSVGPDLADDGGEVRADPQVGGQPKDLGVRLWDPARRRQPPPARAQP